MVVEMTEGMCISSYSDNDDYVSLLCISSHYVGCARVCEQISSCGGDS